MKILIVGNGGREHAFAWKVAQSPQVERVWVAPGNAGTALEPNTENLSISATDIHSLKRFAEAHAVDLTIVGPEAPLAAGIVDLFQRHRLPIFGPSQRAAQLESSKAFCKNFMKRNHIPTATYATFNQANEALDYLKQQSFPIVIKASGLAAGKGVVIAQSLDEAQQTIQAMMQDRQFGDAGSEIVIEEFLNGTELSFIAVVDGKHILPLASSQDHKQRDAGDNGPNTGGMGAYSPVDLSPDLTEQIIQQVMQPTVTALSDQGSPFVGFLYAGLMLTNDETIKVLEFNVRMGDPETQPIMMRLQSDLVEIIQAAMQQKLNQYCIKWDTRTALGVVLACGGYPFEYRKGDTIYGLDYPFNSDVKVFHAGTQTYGNSVVTSGGRVLCVTALGDDLQQAQQKAYNAAKHITWQDSFYRGDIGSRCSA